MIYLWILLVFLSGILMSFAHYFRFNEIEINPSWWTFLLASLGIAVFMKVSSLRSRARTRFGLGFFGGFIYFSITLYWIAIALRIFGELSLGLSIFLSLLLSAYCALFYGLWALIGGFEKIRKKPIFIRIAIWASLWAGLEALREYLFTGFPWGEIGYAFAPWPFIAKTASIWGVHGLSFLWIFIISLLLHLDEWTHSQRSRIMGFSLFIGIFALGIFGSWWQNRNAPDQSLRVALIQPNIQQSMKWDPNQASSHLSLLLEMSQNAKQNDAELIVWPETSYPFLVSKGQRQLPFSSPIPIIVGAVVSDRQVNYNSALFIKGEQVQSQFNKIHLVPFGEFVPFEDYLPFGKLVANSGRFVEGSRDQDLFILEPGFRLGPLICYEDIFSRHSVDLVRKGSNLLVNITNDAWYGRSSAQRQHATMAQMRVFETGIPMVRATNNGLTSIYEWNSEESIPLESEGTLLAEISTHSKKPMSFFVWTFPLMQWIWWIIFAIGLVWKVRYPTKKIFFRE